MLLGQVAKALGVSDVVGLAYLVICTLNWRPFARLGQHLSKRSERSIFDSKRIEAGTGTARRLASITAGLNDRLGRSNDGRSSRAS